MFEENRLRNKLSVIYSDNNKHLPPHKLLDLIIKNNLQEMYSQFTKLCQLVLTISATTASSERSMSTLKRIKSFLRNTMTNERLTNLSSLAIEKNLLGIMAKDPTFVESIIDDFAKKKEKSIELEYKII
uniref:Zinc finger MYM-type protein 1 n=1 Tax=Schizaphis graminum TaxID=13262 RepID=A0A2S2PAB6_SCHGA